MSDSKSFEQKLAQLVGDEKHRHANYRTVADHAHDLSVHFYGKKPVKLLEEHRPNEQEEIKDYRLKIWKPITKSLADKVINTVNKILNPRYFSVKFPEKFPSQLVDEQYQLPTYLANYPVYGTIWNWLKETFLRKDFADPNALVCILPKYIDVEETEQFKPIAKIYSSENVIDFSYGEYYIIQLPEDDKKGEIIYLDGNFYNKYYYSGTEVKLVMSYEHGFGEPPAFFCGGQVANNRKGYFYESFVAGVQAHWDKVVEMTSDKDGSIVNHLYPERYEWQTECDHCDGSGHTEVTHDEVGVPLPEGKAHRVKCHHCEGTGKVTARGPYGAYVISANALNPDSPIPTPPVEYITKDLEPVTKLSEEITAEKEAGFSAINMEILNRVGENQSGVAKVIDRQDLDAFLLRISGHIFDYVLPELMKFTSYWLYSSVMDTDKIDAYLGEIKVSKPVEFNVLSIDNLVEEYNRAKEVGANANYLKNIESEIINIKYARNEEERKKNMLIVQLQPFPDKTVDDLMTAKSIGAVREKDVILNQNIDMIVDKAIVEDDKFLEKTQDEQLDKLYEIIERDYLETDISLIPTDGDMPLIPGDTLDGSEIPQDVDAEAEAKARLKGSVGGVQGILEIQKSVQEGIASKNSAIAVLEEIYGFDKTVANKLLG